MTTTTFPHLNQRSNILLVIAEILSGQSNALISLTEDTDIKALFSAGNDLDSLDWIEVIMQIEDRYNITLDNKVVDAARTGRDFIDLILKKTNK